MRSKCCKVSMDEMKFTNAKPAGTLRCSLQWDCKLHLPLCTTWRWSHPTHVLSPCKACRRRWTLSTLKLHVTDSVYWCSFLFVTVEAHMLSTQVLTNTSCRDNPKYMAPQKSWKKDLQQCDGLDYLAPTADSRSVLALPAALAHWFRSVVPNSGWLSKGLSDRPHFSKNMRKSWQRQWTCCDRGDKKSKRSSFLSAVEP